MFRGAFQIAKSFLGPSKSDVLKKVKSASDNVAARAKDLELITTGALLDHLDLKGYAPHEIRTTSLFDIKHNPILEFDGAIIGTNPETGTKSLYLVDTKQKLLLKHLVEFDERIGKMKSFLKTVESSVGKPDTPKHFRQYAVSFGLCFDIPIVPVIGGGVINRELAQELRKRKFSFVQYKGNVLNYHFEIYDF